MKILLHFVGKVAYGLGYLVGSVKWWIAWHFPRR